MSVITKICLILFLSGMLLLWFAPSMSMQEFGANDHFMNPHRLAFFVFYGRLLSILGAGILGVRLALRKEPS